jgi:hypothetical protein
MSRDDFYDSLFGRAYSAYIERPHRSPASMPPRGGQREYRFRCIEVNGFGARPRAFARRRGHLLMSLGDASSAHRKARRNRR